MQNNDPIGRALLSRNKQINMQQNKTIEKEILSRSLRGLKKNNHSHYYSKSSLQNNNNINKEKEISKTLSFNDIDDDEELDHPKPLVSDSEEDLEMIKSLFIKKIEQKKSLDIYLKSGKIQNLNLKYIPKSSEIPNNIDFSYKEFTNETETNNKNKEKKNINNFNNKKNENYISYKKSYKSETISRKQINQIKNKINNKMNNIISNNDIINYNRDKKQKSKNGHVITITRRKKKNEIESLTNLKEINSNIMQNDIRDINNNQIINENYNYSNIPNNINLINSNQNNNINKKMIYNQKKQANSICIPLSKIKCENDISRKVIKEEFERINSEEKMTQREPSTSIKICQNSSKIKNFLKRKSISIKNINNLNNYSPNKENQTIQSEREYEINKNDINKVSKIQNDSNNELIIEKIKSSEIKEPNFQNRNNLFINHLENQFNSSKYRKKTFERGGKFNNVQTTYVVISKKKNSKRIPKGNSFAPEIIDYNKYKFINPIPSSKGISYDKLYKGQNNPERYSTLNYERMSAKKSKKFGKINSQNNIPIKRYYNYNNSLLNNNNYDTNYRNYIESSFNRNKDIYPKEKGRNTCYLINKSVDGNQSTIPIYDYDNNFDYYYKYDTNHIPNDSFIPFNNNYNY